MCGGGGLFVPCRHSLIRAPAPNDFMFQVRYIAPNSIASVPLDYASLPWSVGAAKVHYTFHSPNPAADATAASVTGTHCARRQVPWWGARSSRQGNPARLRLRPSASPRWPMMTANGCTTPPLARCSPARPSSAAASSVRPPEPPNTHSHARSLAARTLAHSGIP